VAPLSARGRHPQQTHLVQSGTGILEVNVRSFALSGVYLVVQVVPPNPGNHKLPVTSVSSEQPINEVGFQRKTTR